MDFKCKKKNKLLRELSRVVDLAESENCYDNGDVPHTMKKNHAI